MMFSWARLYALMRKEFIQLVRERATAAMIVMLPLIQLMIFGFAINMDPRHLPVAVMMQDRSVLAQSVVLAMERTGYVNVRYLPTLDADMESLLRRGDVQMAVTVPADFSRRVIKGEKAQILAEVDATDPVASAGVVAAVAALPQVALWADLRGPLSRPAGEVPFEVVVHKRYNPEGVTSYNIVPGLLGVILTMTLVMMTAMAVTREIERGTLETLLATPATSFEIMCGKLAPYILIGVAQTFVILAVAVIFFDIPLPGRWQGWGALVLGLSLFIVGNLALGYLISTLSRSQLQASQLSTFVLLPSILLSGFAFPFAGMPMWAQMVGLALPNTHFLRVVRGVLLKDYGWSEVGPSLLVLVAFVVVVTGLAVYRSRTTLD